MSLAHDVLRCSQMNDADRLIVKAWFRHLEQGTIDRSAPVPDERYDPIDYVVANELNLTPARVDVALVACGKRPPVSWAG